MKQTVYQCDQSSVPNAFQFEVAMMLRKPQLQIELIATSNLKKINCLLRALEWITWSQVFLFC